MFVCPLENRTIATLDLSESSNTQTSCQFGSAIIDGLVDNDLSIRVASGKATSAEYQERHAARPEDDSRSIHPVSGHREARAADEADFPANPPGRAS